MTTRFILIAAACLLNTGLLFAGTRDTRSLSIEEAWIREAPPTANVMAAYLTVKNTGRNPASILSITSPAFNSIEIHRTTIINGIARMEPVNTLVIPPGNEVRFEPGGMHLMLVGPNRALRDGDEIKLSFTLDNGNSLSIMAIVRQSTIR